jgi:hypothetical protein
MPDFAMDYDKLYAMQRGLHLLADRSDSGGGTGVYEEVGNASLSENETLFGSYDVAYQFSLFYGKSKIRIDDGKDKLEQFGDQFKGVADGLFQQDAFLASGAATSAGSAMFDRWNAEREAYEQWTEDKEAWDAYLDEIGAADYFAEHPDADIAEVCAEDGGPEWCDAWRENDDPPIPPGPEPDKPSENPPSHIQFEDDDGGTTDIVLSYDDEYNIMKEEMTVTTGDGESITTVTDYETAPQIVEPEDGRSFDTRDYSVTTSSEGWEIVEDITVDDSDGSGTRTVTETTTNEDGEQEVTTTEYTRTGPFEEWAEVGGEGENDDSDGEGDDSNEEPEYYPDDTWTGSKV